MKEYVLGFAFDKEQAESVVLIKKNKPDWQKGLLNGVGGKIEEGESPIQAMIREFAEETGLVTIDNEWKNYCNMIGKDWRVYVFSMFSDDYSQVKTMEEETVEIHPVSDILSMNNSMYISNLPWLIQSALDDNYGMPPFFEVYY